MDGDDEEDEMWIIQAVGKLIKALRSDCREAGSESVEQRLLRSGEDTIRTFEDLYNSANSFLFRDHFRMKADDFDALYELCKPLIPTKIEHPREVIAVTLDWLGRGASCRDQELKFSLAYSTIHRYRRVGLYAVVTALHYMVKMPSAVPDDFVSRFPYFEQAIAAIDGVHIPVVVTRSDAERFRNRKGWTSTNVLIASDWSMNVAFLYVGAEGAAHDSMVLSHGEFLLSVPDCHYVIADAGYALQPQVLTPYRGVRYHRKEFAEGTGRPANKKELFNLRHAKARNIVERLIGCLKRRFKILRVPIECEFAVAKAAIFACACLHNFIRQRNGADLAEDMCGNVSDDAEDDNEEDARAPLPFDFSE
ncbi:hypothetical protein BBJ28_00024260 [Nothophytophthora sp. Chile5]|nr:hypothetical protein BBJ28_00024260 [Nothophytophthora sp. Chile5]